jgi:probable F420-dependent oxidoreductase
VARAAESLGYDSVVFSEHLVTPLTGDVPPIGRSWPEIHVLAAYLAGMTEVLRFVFYATVVPYRHPIQQARLVATLDQVSAGRVTLVAGAGWLEGEFDALGVPFANRGQRTTEHLRAMQALWTEPEPEFDGEYVSFGPVEFEPKCVQQPHVPVWVGGIGRHARRRLVELGDGWGAPIPWPLDKLARELTRIKAEVQDAGRDASLLAFAHGISFGVPDAVAAAAFTHVAGAAPVERPPSSAAETLELVGQYADLGFTHLVVSTDWDSPADYARKLEWFAENVMQRV